MALGYPSNRDCPRYPRRSRTYLETVSGKEERSQCTYKRNWIGCRVNLECTGMRHGGRHRTASVCGTTPPHTALTLECLLVRGVGAAGTDIFDTIMRAFLVVTRSTFAVLCACIGRSDFSTTSGISLLVVASVDNFRYIHCICR
jgi:hypothetical protein